MIGVSGSGLRWVGSIPMFRTLRHLPFFKIVAVLQVALLARRHLGALTPTERRRAASLVRRTRHLTPAERHELINIAMKLEPHAFAGAVASKMSPVPLPKKLTGRSNGRGSRSKTSPTH